MAESIDMDELLEDEIKARRERGDYVDETDDELDEELEEVGDGEDEEDLEPEGDEEEDEEDGEDEEGLEEEPEEEELDDVKENRVPQSRLNEVVGQRETYKERAEWLQEQLEKVLSSNTKPGEVAEPDPYDFDQAENDYVEFIVGGEVAKAASLRKEIDSQKQAATDRTIEKIRAEAIKSAEDKSSHAVDEDRFTTLVEMYENEYSFLDKNSDVYNEEAVDTVNALMAGYLANGDGKADALKKAIKKATPFYDEAKKPSLGNRKKKAVKRNIKASRRQPAPGRSSRVEKDDGDIDVVGMSDKQFRNLSKRDKAILRGDIVA